jgi:hypothetical protein
VSGRPDGPYVANARNYCIRIDVRYEMAPVAWSKRVTRLVADLRVSQGELAGLVGVDPATIWRWAKGAGDPPSDQRIVEALERIVASRRVDDFFRALRDHRIQPRSREMLEAIFQFSSTRSYA